MTKNILYAVAGLVLGFIVGFLVANFGGRPRTAGAGINSSSVASQTGGQLPPGHPNVNGADDVGSTPAASSAQAQAAMDEADRNPQDFNAQIRAAAIFFQLRSLDKATLYLTRSLALKPNDTDALTGMGQTKYDLGDYAGAASYFEKALAQNPDEAAELRISLGDTYFRRSPPDYTRAMAEYRKALEIDPKNEQALATLAAAALRKGDKTSANEAINKLAEVNPSSAALPTLRAKLNDQ